MSVRPPHLGNANVVLSANELDALMHVLAAVLDRKFDEDGGGEPVREVFIGFEEMRAPAIRARLKIQAARAGGVAPAPRAR